MFLLRYLVEVLCIFVCCWIHFDLKLRVQPTECVCMKSDNIFLALWTHVVHADGLKRVLHMTHSSRAKKTAATTNCLG